MDLGEGHDDTKVDLGKYTTIVIVEELEHLKLTKF